MKGLDKLFKIIEDFSSEVKKLEKELRIMPLHIEYKIDDLSYLYWCPNSKRVMYKDDKIDRPARDTPTSYRVTCVSHFDSFKCLCKEKTEDFIQELLKKSGKKI